MRKLADQHLIESGFAPMKREQLVLGLQTNLPLFRRRAASHTLMPSYTSTFMRLAMFRGTVAQSVIRGRWSRMHY